MLSIFVLEKKHSWVLNALIDFLAKKFFLLEIKRVHLNDIVKLQRNFLLFDLNLIVKEK
jgi:hypothetical protein